MTAKSVHPLPPLREHGYAGTTGERLLAITPPRVRVVRLHAYSEHEVSDAFYHAARAARCGELAIESMTERSVSPVVADAARMHARFAARFARLALGASR